MPNYPPPLVRKIPAGNYQMPIDFPGKGGVKNSKPQIAKFQPKITFLVSSMPKWSQYLSEIW
jgi:hypothetical protein